MIQKFPEGRVQKIMTLLGKDKDTATNVLLSMGHPEGCQLCMDVMRDDKNRLPPPRFLYFQPREGRAATINTSIAFYPRTFKTPSKAGGGVSQVLTAKCAARRSQMVTTGSSRKTTSRVEEAGATCVLRVQCSARTSME